MPIRTLHLTNAWHPTSGGVRTFYQALLDAAVTEHRHMTLVVPGDRTSVACFGPTVRLYTIAAPRSPAFDRRYRVILPHRLFWPRRSDVCRILAHERPDLVEISDKYSLCYLGGLIKSRARGGPRPTLVGLSQERLDDNLRAWLGPRAGSPALARWYLARVYLPQFDVHLANSAYTAEELRDVIEDPRYQLHLERLRGRVRVLPMGVDLSGFGPERRRAVRRRDLLDRTGGGEAPLVIYAGRLSPEKQLDWIVEAARLLIARRMDLRLVIAGDGPSRDAFGDAITAVMPGRVTMLGHVRSRAELSTLVASADLFLHPNPREPFGIGPLEAMAAGVPVVAPRAGGLLSYADDDTAWLAEASPSGLASAVLTALAHPELSRLKVQAARLRAQDFSWPRTAARYFAAYEDLHRERLAPLPALTGDFESLRTGSTSAPLTIS